MDRELTDLQQSVLARLRKHAGCYMLASVIEHNWRRGKGYYIDSRVGVSRQLRRDFETANRTARTHHETHNPED